MRISNIFATVIVLLLVSTLKSQSLQPEIIADDFLNASSFSINPAGFIFVADNTNNEIYKIDTLGNVIKSIGGYGWDEYSFDEPVDIFATTLNVYISDKNNNRVEIYDKDLNFLSHFRTDQLADQDLSFAYPTCSGVSNQGDLFILDSDNQRILKYNLRGDYLQEIGSYESGDYMLSDPKCFAIAPDNKLFVLDENQLVIFDQFGTGIHKIELSFVPNNINVTFNQLVIAGNHSVKFVSFTDGSFLIKPLLTNFDTDKEIIDALIFKKKLYLLFNDSIQVIKIKK